MLQIQTLLKIALTFVSMFEIASATEGDSNSRSVIHFETHVRGILKEHCFHCHGENETFEGGLDLRLVRFMKKGGDSGSAIVSGEAEQSLLFQRVRDGEMPPDEGKLLSHEETTTLRNWLASGATTARDEPESLDEDYFVTAEEQSHWAFRPLERPAIPKVRNPSAVANPIDAFLLSKLETAGFGFSKRAPKHTLLRRAYFDLHGLPPTRKAIDAFLDDDREDAWPRLVESLLHSERYGERWARHWLDVAGYADSEGYNDADLQRPHAWRYRDYVIRSFNEDKPFDQFISEQLAGDEMVTSPAHSLSRQDAEQLIATGFLRMAPDGTGGKVANADAARNETIGDTIKIVSSSLMAMTVGCAQCHDHRYDPISQADYFRFRAIFEPAFDWKRWRNPQQRLVSMYTEADRAVAARIEEQAKQIEATRAGKQAEFIQATFEKQLAELPAEIHEAAHQAHQTAAGKRTEAQKSLFRKHPNLNVTAGSLYLYDKKAADELKKLADQASQIRATKPQENFVRALTELDGKIPETRLFNRGDYEQPRQKLQPAGLGVVSLSAHLPEVPENADHIRTSGRRLAFAKRLTSPNHPLTARVFVNRVWMHHFGHGIVRTPSDFGMLGQPPTHPQLLDWLAKEFIDSGWSVKHLHRLILSSTAWQQRVGTNDELLAADPDNVLYGRANLRRLDAETLRDSILQVAEKLNPKSYGPPVPVMADRVGRWVIGQENLNAGRPGDKIDLKGEEFRRSIYVQVRRSRPLSLLDAFDQPPMAPNCDKRRPSTGSIQSLMMMNSDLLLEHSRSMARRLATESPRATLEQIRSAWLLAYARLPSDEELKITMDFLRTQTDWFAKKAGNASDKDDQSTQSAAQEATALMCQMLLNSNEFLYID